MKALIGLFTAIAAFGISEVAQAQASYDNISLGTTIGRRFNTSRTADSLGCEIVTGSCPTGAVRMGYNPNEYSCCSYRAMTAEEVVALNTESFAVAFTLDPQTEAYWGYNGASNRSPNGGRTTSYVAKLDVCLGDTIVSGLSGHTACHNACDDSTKNIHCQANWSNNGSTQAAGVCHDRCECIYGDNTCNNL